MANDNVVVEETEKILGIMDESEETLSGLQQNLKINECIQEQLKHNLKELKEFNDKQNVALKNSQNLKINIRKRNEQFFLVAQQIYSSSQEIYSDLNLRQKDLDKANEKLDQTKNKFVKKGTCNEIKQTIQKDKSNKLMQLQHKEKERKALDLQLLREENETLKNKLIKVETEGEMLKCIINDSDLYPNETRYEEDIANIENLRNQTNHEINDVVKLLENMDNTTEEKIKFENFIKELNERIKQAEDDITSSKQLEEYKRYNEAILKDYAEIDTQNEKMDKDCEQQKQYCDEIEKDILQHKQRDDKQLEFYKETLCEKEKALSNQINLREYLNNDKLETKIEEFDGEIKNLKTNITFLEETRTQDVIQEKFKDRQNELKDIKVSRQAVKAENNKKFMELESKKKKLNDEISEIEIKTKILQEEIDTTEVEINKLKIEEQQIKTDNNSEQYIKKLEQLDIKIESLNVEIARTKTEIIKKTRKQKIFNKPAIPTKEKKVEVKKRNWDSDSSLEGEDGRFLDVAKSKIKKKFYTF